RRIRELNVYCEIYPYNKVPEIDSSIKGVILSGSPCSVNSNEITVPDISHIRGKLPVLGICFGAQHLTHVEGGKVESQEIREYGRAHLKTVDNNDSLLKGVGVKSQVWMSHGDTITKVATGAKIIASTDSIPVAAFKFENESTWGIQFHPEVYHTTHGSDLLKNFAVDICRCKQDWTPASFVESTVHELQQQLGDDKVVLGLSGGVDSTVAAVILNKAIGKNLTCIFVDNGLLRKNEFEGVMQTYRGLGLNVIGVDAKRRFYKDLKGIASPEEKRKVIGKGFIEVFDEEAHKIKDVKWLAQGTIYPDVIESINVQGQTIKSHHNVGGLPEKMKLKVVEPLNKLFKDEVRRIGSSLSIDTQLINRHPFPGPGLGVRILGEVTEDRVKLLQEADHIFIQGLKDSNLYDKVWQAGVMLLPVKSVGVMGDERSYENVVALRAVNSTDGMTADWSHLPHEFLSKVSNDIINRVRGINRVVYDISSKPPATIEWE
ncbi:MAG: glutamine-hydrolyzing GMP synthase, partial [Prevotellaceae bacterium]|nr:glutamine-hydrolyzing GMP synthase [Prevotellaceae bacterium]